MPVKAAFFDIDWTIFDHDRQDWDWPSIKAIAGLKKKGVDSFLATARPLDSIAELGAFDLGIEWRGYVSSAGAYSVVDGKTVKEFLIDEESAVSFLRFIRFLGIGCEIVYERECHFFGIDTPFSNSYYKEFHETKRLSSAGRPRAQNVVGFNLFAGPEYDALFARKFPNLYFKRHSPFGVDVMSCLREKSDGIKAVLDYCGYSKEEAIAFGDGLQDIPMASSARFVAMGNASDEVKAAADEIAPPVAESGVYRHLKQIGLAD